MFSSCERADDDPSFFRGRQRLAATFLITTTPPSRFSSFNLAQPPPANFIKIAHHWIFILFFFFSKRRIRNDRSARIITKKFSFFRALFPFIYFFDRFSAHDRVCRVIAVYTLALYPTTDTHTCAREIFLHARTPSRKIYSSIASFDRQGGELPYSRELLWWSFFIQRKFFFFFILLRSFEKSWVFLQRREIPVFQFEWA